MYLEVVIMNGPGFIIGNIAKRDDFWNRKEEIQTIWKTLEKNNVLLKAPRRFGKTSIMNHLFEFPDNNFNVFFQDTESVRTPEEFVSGIVSMLLTVSSLRKLYKSISGKMKDLIKGVEIGMGYEDMPEIRVKIKESLRKDWQEEGRKLISHLQKYDGKILFILDELPELIKNIKTKKDKNTAVDFLLWFRSIRQMSELSHVRWLVGGSIGIEHVVENIGAGTKTINDFAVIKVEHFSETEARAFIKALLKSDGHMQHIKSSTIDKLLETIGAPVPYFIQILLNECLYEMKRQNKKSLNDEIIEKAYYENLLSPANRSYFQHYYSRLKEYYDVELEKIAKKVLIEIARGTGTTKIDLFRLFNQESGGRYPEEDFNYLMTHLENDFYVSYERGSNRYLFTTKVLKDWWLRYYDLVEV
jgi:hypothetical protein